MALSYVSPVQFKTCILFRNNPNPFRIPYRNKTYDAVRVKPLVIQAKARGKANTQKESSKIRNRRIRKKYNGTPTRPRLSVFCSDKQLYAMLVDDRNKKCLFYGSTLQKSIRENPSCTTTEAARRLGEELVKSLIELNIHEISSYDCNGFARGERMQAFEIAISQHGLLPD